LRIPQETIDAIRERSDVVEVVSRYLELQRAGRNFRALCPFHDEKTPSFMVSPERQSFHCFGCEKGGNVFTFVMEMEGVSFPEAVRSLGRLCGVEVPSRDISDDERSKNEDLYEANRFAADWYREVLRHPRAGQAARDYLDRRGISETFRDRFGLGFAPDSWDGLFRAARQKDFPSQNLVEAKLIISRESQKGYYDYFRKRLMFPIISPSGRVIAFGARALDPKDDPKYLNSPESPVFSKRRTLYGLGMAREAIRRQRQAVLVEGYTDCISLHQIGIEQAVASCGTAFTPDHALVLRRLTRQAVLIPDGDEAGEGAALSAGMMLIAAGLEVRVVRLEADQDPDSAAQALGREKFEKLMTGGIAYFDYFNYILSNRVKSPLDREALIKRALQSLDTGSDQLRREMIIQELGRVLAVDPGSLRSQLNVGRTPVHSGKTNSYSISRNRRTKLEKLVLRLLLEDFPAIIVERERLDGGDFIDENCRKYHKLLDFAWESHIDLRSAEFQRMTEEAGLERLAAEIAIIPFPPGNFDVLLRDTIKRIKALKIQDELRNLRDKLKRLPVDSEEAVAVVEYTRKLKQALSEL
jgi:DNA primase